MKPFLLVVILLGAVAALGVVACTQSSSPAYPYNNVAGVPTPSGPPSWKNVGNAGFSAGIANDTSLAFNGSTPYVAYQDFNHSLKASVMDYTGGAWANVGSADFSAGEADYVSLAFGGSTPYVAYRDGSHGYLATVMEYTGGNWVGVGSPGFSAGFSDDMSLAVNGGVPYLSYLDYGNSYRATVMEYTGTGATGWTSLGSPGFSVGQADWTSLAFNGSTAYVAFDDEGISYKASVMKYTGTGATGWVNVGTAGFSPAAVDFTSLAIYNGVPYVAYADGNSGDKVTVMEYTGAGATGWVAVGSPGFSTPVLTGTYLNLSLTFNGSTPYVAYGDTANSDNATVMMYNGSSWVLVGNAGFSAGAAEQPSLAIFGNVPYVAYGDAGNSNKATVMAYH